MLYLFVDRENLLHFLPKGGRAAEIGSFRGDFAAHVVDKVQPDRLHLIDPWIHQDRPDYLSDHSNVSDAQHADNLQQVRTRFAEPIAAGQVVLHRAFSNDAAADFADGGLDWVYVDGLHTYQGVMDDLEHYAPKVRDDGLILGHDYTTVEAARREGYGVVEAVDDFVRRGGWEFVALTAEGAASFALARKPLRGMAEEFVARLLYNVPLFVEIRDYPQRPFIQRQVDFPDGRMRQFASF